MSDRNSWFFHLSAIACGYFAREIWQGVKWVWRWLHIG